MNHSCASALQSNSLGAWLARARSSGAAHWLLITTVVPHYVQNLRITLTFFAQVLPLQEGELTIQQMEQAVLVKGGKLQEEMGNLELHWFLHHRLREISHNVN